MCQLCFFFGGAFLEWSNFEDNFIGVQFSLPFKMFLSEEHSWPFRSVSEFSVSICSSPRTGLTVGKHHKKFYRPLSVFGSSNFFTRKFRCFEFFDLCFWKFLGFFAQTNPLLSKYLLSKELCASILGCVNFFSVST